MDGGATSTREGILGLDDPLAVLDRYLLDDPPAPPPADHSPRASPEVGGGLDQPGPAKEHPRSEHKSDEEQKQKQLDDEDEGGDHQKDGHGYQNDQKQRRENPDADVGEVEELKRAHPRT